MSERTALGATMETMTLEEPGGEEASPRALGPLRCGPCAMLPRQQTWLCVVPLLMGFVGLGLSLMLLKWIVVGSVQDYVPTDLVDAKGIGQDPIFLSKPSAVSKGPDSPTTSTGLPANTAGPGSSADGTGTVHRTQAGPSLNHSSSSSSGARVVGGGSGNRVPHLHNRVGTRANGTAIPAEKDGTSHSTTVKKPGSGGHRNVYPSSRALPPSPTLVTTTSETTNPTTTKSTATKVPPPTTSSTRPNQRLNHGRSSKGPSTKPTRPHHRFRAFATPTVPSEIFKRCQDSQELAFCLNEGECFIIETVAGVHRHCRCKEGYRGLRCDQFVPKTDPILSDPTADELGIEFMEIGEIYQRQILSIFSIAMGISVLGMLCMALYCRNKRQRRKPKTHLTESRSLRDSSLNASRLMSKSSPKNEHQKCCKAQGSSCTPGNTTELKNPEVSSPNKKRCSPAVKQKISNHRPVSRWTPPISRAGHLIGGSKDSICSYKHLREVEPTDATIESLKRFQSQPGGNQHTHLNMQLTHSRVRLALADVPCTRLDQGTAFPPPSRRTCSVPIIPSVQATNLKDGVEDQDGSVVISKSAVSSSHTFLNPKTDEESVLNSSHSLVSSVMPHALTRSESALRGKHKSLVTYTGPHTDPNRAKTVVSVTVLGSEKQPLHGSTNLSKSMGRVEPRHVQTANGERHEHGTDALLTRRQKDCHVSPELKDVSCLKS
ncbi:pro-neuregulin-3, membrane-bound isoform [Trichomycterus rosablanca]|uniref:pro-neuregulin-3, membrane-bound isoform n=1 Tax=Trichomycterus rosablanca TaxID=2290929 RepID=UPI002F357523